MEGRIAFVTLGCKLNYAETSTYERALSEAGFEATPWTSGRADLFLVNTCSVTEHSDKKCRNIIRKLHRLRPEAPIVVTGCYAQLKREEILALEGVRGVFGAREKAMVVPHVIGLLSGPDGGRARDAASGGGSVEDAGCDAMFPAYSSGERTRSFLKVQDGCDNYCTYCTVPYARGGSRNIPIAEIIAQARCIASQGVREIVLTGVNTGDFGRSTGEDFFSLIRELDRVEGIGRYRISSIEPNLLTEEMIDWIASDTKFLPHFHIPLQSGCDEVLSQMHRHYDTEYFARKIEYIRSAMEGPGKLPVFFGIDVIAGFPGESDDMFEQTFRFLEERVRPSFIHIFPYSRRAGTPAAERTDQVQERVKTERVERLEALCERLHSEFVESCRGMKAKVLFESSDRKGMMTGYTENYIQVSRPYDKNLVGEVCEVTI